jgi:hypothetical protein
MAGALCSCLIAGSLFSTSARADETALPAVTEAAAPLAATPVKLSTSAAAPHQPKRANFNKKIVPESIRHLADWVADSGDNRDLPFVIIDKREAKEFVFDKTGKLLGSAWVLVGLAKGDDSAPGVGDMPLADITPEIRTTPAGRFVSALGHDLGKLDVVWVDYDNAISMHRVINTNPAERRLTRIVSKNPAEHRISYGCINVPAKFFDKYIDPTFKGAGGIVYVLPEVKSMAEVFPQYYDVDQKPAVLTAASGSAHTTTATIVAPEQ